MSDIAQLGLAVDSSQVKTATSALNQFSTASSTAANSADKLATAGGKSETVMRAIAAAAKRSNISYEEMEKRVDGAAAGHSRLVAASGKAQQTMQSLSAQTKLVANDNAALGTSTDKTTSSFDRLAARFTRGLIAGAALAAIKQTADYLFNLNSQLAATADTAQRVGIGGQQFQGLQTAAAYKGVGNDSFNTAMLAFNQQLDLAKHGLGDLKTLLSANGKVVGDTATTFGVVADLVKNAGSEAQKFSILQQAGLPATREFVKLMEQGGDAITRQSIAATKLRDDQLEAAQKLDDRWRQMWVNFTNWGKQAALDVGQGISNIPTPFAHQGTWLGQKLQGLGFDRPEDPNSARNQGLSLLRQGQGTQLGANAANGIYNATGAFGNQATDKKTFDPALAKQQIGLEQQRLGLLSPLATAEDAVRSKQLEINAAALNNVGISKSQADALKLVALAQFEMNRVQQQASLGIFNASAAQKAFNDQLQSMIAQKLIDPKNVEQMAAAQTVYAKQLRETSDAAKVAASNFPQLQQAMNEASNANKQLDAFGLSTVNSLADGFTSAISGAKSFSASIKDMATSVLNDLARLTIRNGLLSLVGGATTGSSGAGLFSGLGKLFGFADGGYTGPGARLKPAGIVHAGEYVFSQASVNRIGLGNLDAMHRAGVRGYADGGLVSNIMPMRSAVNSNSGPITIVGPTINVQGNMDDKTMRVVDEKFAAHQKAIESIVKNNRSQQNYQMTGVG